MIEQLDALKRRVVDTLSQVGDPSAESDPFQAPNVIAETSSHDFTSYLFAFDPLVRQDSLTLLSADEADMFLAAIAAALEAGIPSPLVLTEGTNYGTYIQRDETLWDWTRDPAHGAAALARRLYRTAFAQYSAVQLAGRIGGMGHSDRSAYLGRLVLAFRVKLADQLRAFDWAGQWLGSTGDLLPVLDNQGEFWTDSMEQALAAVPATETRTPGPSPSRTSIFGATRFTPFEPETVNFGVQLVYRQLWRPVGTQVGDIVRTIPLGPGQKEKVSIKTMRRSTVRQSFERNQVEERSFEQTSASKDSMEVVGEASSSFRWNTEVAALDSTERYQTLDRAGLETSGETDGRTRCSAQPPARSSGRCNRGGRAGPTAF